MRTARYEGVAFMFAILVATVAMAEVPEAILKQAWYPKAPPLPKPAGQVIRVYSVDDIYRAAKNLQPGSTILVADGHYMMTHTLYIFIDCDTGIALGNSSGRRERRHCSNFVVRNNFITRCPESNILADHTRDCKIINNTVHDPKNRMRRLIRVIHANDGLVVKNNIFSGPGVSIEKYTGKIDIDNNVIKPVSGYFVDPAMGNLHLTEKAGLAIDKALWLNEVTDDIDRGQRSRKPDIGADELGLN